MRIMTILGTRPEIIRLSRVIPLLDRHCEHLLVHTGQNYDRQLNQVFFEELGLRAPDHVLDCRGATAMEQIGRILVETERLMAARRPDRLLILGDTNSALSAVAAKRLGIPVFHMEAGNRCYDDRVPEEINRRIVDHCSDLLLPYTERSRENLLREGIPGERILVTGNPIREVLEHYRPQIDASEALARLGLEAGGYFLVTLHRAENVDLPERFASFLEALDLLHREYGCPVVCSTHPRTRARLEAAGHHADGAVRFLEPLGLFDFVHLERNARCVLSDSGTVQEEACLFHVPNVTLRDVTERPETVESGSNILSGAEPAAIAAAAGLAMAGGRDWPVPAEYAALGVSLAVAKIVTGYRHDLAA